MDVSSAIGAGVGGLLGGMDANSGPAGYTTSSSTRREDIPDWLKPYVTTGLGGAEELFGNLKKKGSSPVLDMSEQELMNVISGKYLSPDSNPWIADIGKRVAAETGNAVDSRFSAAGRYGPGAGFTTTLSHGIGDALATLYGGNYAAERTRQNAATLGAPAFAASSVGAEFAPYADFLKLIPNLKDSTGTQTDPYFRNKGAGILGGALAGSQLARMFGGSGGGGGGGGYDNAGADYSSMGGEFGFGSFG